MEVAGHEVVPGTEPAAAAAMGEDDETHGVGWYCQFALKADRVRFYFYLLMMNMVHLRFLQMNLHHGGKICHDFNHDDGPKQNDLNIPNQLFIAH